MTIGSELVESRKGRVATLAIERPARRNALSAGLVAALDQRLRMLDADVDIGAIVLTGSGAGFCAGSDLKELAATDLKGMAMHEAETGRVARSMALLDKPVIAAVEGFAMGGGLGLAAACDIVVTAPDCRWQLPEVPLGWFPPWGMEALVQRCGAVTARRLVWGEHAFDGREAHRLGLADALADGGEVLAAARQRAERIAALSVHAVIATKRYFARTIAAQAEAADAEANRLFIDNCRHSVARATFARYGLNKSVVSGT